MIVQRRCQVERSAGHGGVGEFDAIPHAPASSIELRCLGAAVLQQVELDVIVIGQDDIGQRKRHMACRQEFFLPRWERHGRAGIDKDVGKKIDFLAEDFDEQPIAARVDAPVDITKVIAGRVAPVVGEFQAGAAPRRRISARVAAEKFLPGAQPKGLKLA